MNCPKCGSEALTIKRDESIEDYYICIKCGHIFKEASMSKKELKCGDLVEAWDRGYKEYKDIGIWVGFDGKVHWVICGAADIQNFRERSEFGIMIMKYDYAQPYDAEVDWLKVPRNTKVLVSDDGACWLEAYFCAYLECAKSPYLVFWDDDIRDYVEQDIATGAVGVKYCQFPKDFEVPEEWLKEDCDD